MGVPRRPGRDWPEASQERAVLAAAGPASCAPTARHAVSRTRACRVVRPATAQPRDPRRHVSAPSPPKSHPPRQQDARCTPRYTAAERLDRRNPGNARRPRYPRCPQPKEDHPDPQRRARSRAAQNVRPAGALRKCLSTRPALAGSEPAPQPQDAAPGCEPGTPPRPWSAGRNRRRGQARSCAPSTPPGRFGPAAWPRSRCRPGSSGGAAPAPGQYNPVRPPAC